MKINQVKTANKIGDFVSKKNHRNKIDLKYVSSISRQVLNDDTARIYLFVVDGVLKKIGGSAGKGGIKNTMNFYVSAMTGSPGVPRFVVHLLIAEALQKGSKVELYMITSPKVLATVNGLFGSKKVKIASFKEMENLCKSDYYTRESKYPDWNFQENHQPFPTKLAKLHN
ncbi:MAG: hypothetical protein AABY22_13835, partial [Nanoarchaeota archaeon]